MGEHRQAGRLSVGVRDPKPEVPTDTTPHYKELVEIYEKSRAPVEVDFRSLVSWVRLGDQLTHQVHPYPAKLLPLIAHFFVRAKCLVNNNSIVLDPFCGSGTVALEASLAGHTAYVADANPLAIVLTKVKTIPYEVEQLRKLMGEILTSSRRFRTAPHIPVVNESIWYSPRVKLSLEKIARAVQNIHCDDSRMFFEVCLSSVARKLSMADPAVSVPVRLKVSSALSSKANQKIKQRLHWLKTTNVMSEFARVCEANIKRVDATNREFQSRLRAVQVGVDAKNLRPESSDYHGVADASIPLVITSPPYGSAQKYIRSSSLSLNWLRLAAPADLAEVEASSIGREHTSRSHGLQLDRKLPKAYKDLLDKVELKNPARRRITDLYLHELKMSLLEIARVLKVGGHAVVVIGNNQVCGETLRNDHFISLIMASAGLKLELSLLDTIKSRGLMTKRNKTASVISRESVLVFKKV